MSCPFAQAKGSTKSLLPNQHAKTVVVLLFSLSVTIATSPPSLAPSPPPQSLPFSPPKPRRRRRLRTLGRPRHRHPCRRHPCRRRRCSCRRRQHRRCRRHHHLRRRLLRRHRHRRRRRLCRRHRRRRRYHRAMAPAGTSPSATRAAVATRVAVRRGWTFRTFLLAWRSFFADANNLLPQWWPMQRSRLLRRS